MAAVKKKIIPNKKKTASSSATKATVKQKSRNNIAALKLPRLSVVPQISGSSEKFPPRVQQMLDERDVTRVVMNLARALDRSDETLLRSVLHADATLDFGPGMFQGSGNDYVHWVKGVMHGIKSSHHQLGQSRVEVEGDVAFVETYANIHFRVDKPVGREDVFMGCRFLDRMERRPAGANGVWKIMHRKQVIDFVRTEAVSDIFYHQNPDALWVNKGKIDPSSQMANFPGSHSHGRTSAYMGRRYESKSVRF